MTLTTESFGDFIAEMYDNRKPFLWQQRLVDHIVDEGQWPDRIVAPTGAGKSAVVDVHVFVNALRTKGFRPPRRMFLVVNRRALVDSQYGMAVQLRKALSDPRDKPTVAAVAESLGNMCAVEPSDSPLGVVEMRGELPRDRSWVDDPTRCLIFCATPHMFGSRMLFAGYGSSRLASPREAGLIGFDSVLILDEAHLNRQLLHTARRAAELIGVRERNLGVPSLHVVECTATPSDESGTSVGVRESDLDADDVLRERLTRPKPLKVIHSRDYRAGKASNAYIRELTNYVVMLHEHCGRGTPEGRTIGCVVNRVDTAVRVAEELKKTTGLRIQTLVGRMRPYDRLGLPASLLTVDGDPDTDILIATQTVEVGADFDLSGMVTEVAPGSALVQRAGRVNRLGGGGPVKIVVVGPDGDEVVADNPPYRASDLDNGWSWIRRRAEDATGLAPLSIQRDPAPAESPRRQLWQRLELKDSELLSNTAGLFDAPDLALWLEDDTDNDDSTCGLVVRDLAILGKEESEDHLDIPIEAEEILGFIRALPPDDVEVFPCRISVLRSVIKEIREGDDFQQLLLYRDGEVSVYYDEPSSEDKKLRPGDVVIVDSESLVCVDKVVHDSPTSKAKAVPLEELSKVIEVIRDRAVLKRYRDLTLEEMQEQYGDGGQVQPGPLIDGGIPQWIIVTTTSSAGRDERVRQEWSASGAVLLSDHSRDVAARAAKICAAVGIVNDVEEAVVKGAEYHDAGKADQRFQVMLGAEGEIYAKSAKRSKAAVRAAQAASNLPTGWRHEQLSVVRASELLGEHPDRDTILRLVGTSHGHGRPWFPHGARGLVPDPTPESVRLFDVGLWNELIKHTGRMWGEWGIAYLEALLRAADAQVSREGR